MDSTSELLRKVSIAMEAKLIELMGKTEYSIWSKELAKKCYMQEIESMPNSEFKQFCIDNFEVITK